jgi:hypothetical protein
MGEELYHREREPREPTGPAGPSPKPPSPPKPPAPPVATTVRDITKSVFDALGLTYTPDGNNLCKINMPGASTFKVIDESRFAFGTTKPLEFREVSNNVGRIAIFAGKKGVSERAVILVLPNETAPNAVLAVISARFSQNSDFFQKLGGGDPLSPKVILFVLNSHLKDNHGWASQMLASSKKMAVVYIVRSLASKTVGELGPFATDGVFFRDCLGKMRELTNDSFDFDSVTAMSFSLGIFDLNPFVGAISKQVNVTRVINLDPERATHAERPKKAVAVEFLSGETGVGAGFELLLPPRWEKEDLFKAKEKSGAFKTKPGRLAYFHDRCIANYCLRLALEKS